MRQLGNILFVGAGGFIGAVARYVLGGWVHKLIPLSTFPLGTLALARDAEFLRAMANIGGNLMGGLASAWV